MIDVPHNPHSGVLV